MFKWPFKIFFPSKNKTKAIDYRILSKRTLEAHIHQNNDSNSLIFTSATTSELDKGTAIEIFVDKKSVVKNHGINGSNVPIEIVPALKDALKTKGIIRIKKSIVEFDFSKNKCVSFEEKYINKRTPIEEYTTDNTHTFPEIIDKKKIFVTVKPSENKKTKISKTLYKRLNLKSKLYQEEFPINIINNNPFRKLFLTKAFFNNLNSDKNNLFNMFYSNYSIDSNIISDKDNFCVAWNWISKFTQNSRAIKEAYVKASKEESHSKSLEIASKTKFRTPSSLIIPINKNDTFEALEFILNKDKDFIINQWNSKTIDENKVKEYIVNRRSIYNIDSKKRVYSTKKIINGYKDNKINKELKTNSSEKNYLKMQKEDKYLSLGIVKIFKHSISSNKFYSIVK